METLERKKAVLEATYIGVVGVVLPLHKLLSLGNLNRKKKGNPSHGVVKQGASADFDRFQNVSKASLNSFVIRNLSLHISMKGVS